MKRTILSIMLVTITLFGCAGNNKSDNANASSTPTGQTTSVNEEEIEAPDFTLDDINGNPLTLSSLRGKYVILDFWGSWCGWCIKGFPQMKEYYQKYSGKFEILGIDCNDTKARWKAAVEYYELPWLHVYCPRRSQIFTDYAIEGFPTKVIIDPKGNIVDIIIGEDPAFYTLLDQLFK